MTATIHRLPGAEPGLILSVDEIRGMTGKVQPAAQLRALHKQGYSRAYRAGEDGHVILERAHVEAVARGQFGQVAANDAPRAKLPPNIAGYRAAFGVRKGA